MKYLLCGPCDRSGIGAMTRDIATYGKPEHWLITKGQHLTDEDFLQQYKQSYTLPNTVTMAKNAWRRLLFTKGQFDAILFVERLLYLPDVESLELASAAGVKVACIPMWEAFPQGGWTQHVDLIWATAKYTRLCLDIRSEARPWTDKIYGDRWGIPLGEFFYKRRTRCNRFLFVDGHGGQKERKGADTLQKLLEAFPDLPFTVTTQRSDFPALNGNTVEIIREDHQNRADCYKKGDVLVSLSHWEGLGLPLYEAQACGLPVVAPDHPPMNECRPTWLIPGSVVKQEVLRTNTVDRWEADIQATGKLLTSLVGADISEASYKSRHNIEQHYRLSDVLCSLETAFAKDCLA